MKNICCAVGLFMLLLSTSSCVRRASEPVIPSGPAARVSLCPLLTLPGMTISMPVYIDYSKGHPDEIADVNEITLTVSYNAEYLAFLRAEPLGAMKDWQYFTYRHGRDSTCRGPGHGSVLIRAIRKLEPLDSLAVNQRPEGVLANLEFFTASQRGEFVAEVGFSQDTCFRNVLHGAGDTVYL